MAATVLAAGTVLDLSELTQEQFWVAMVGLTLDLTASLWQGHTVTVSWQPP